MCVCMRACRVQFACLPLVSMHTGLPTSVESRCIVISTFRWLIRCSICELPVLRLIAANEHDLTCCRHSGVDEVDSCQRT